MLQGYDVSNHNKNVPYKNCDFLIIKASEGINYKDEALDFHLANFFGTSDPTPQKEKLYGFYHYARPDLGNTPKQEAESFLSFISPQIGNCIMALDWEGESLKFSENWALEWLNYIKDKTGVKPLFYINSANTYLFKQIAAGDFGLWLADWSDSPTFDSWQFWAIWQNGIDSTLNLDHDFFNGDSETWKKYCLGQNVSHETQPQEKVIEVKKGETITIKGV